MAKIIELSGTPGAGKSTLYKELDNSWTTGNNWVPAHHLYPKMKRQSNSVKGFIAFLMQKFTKGRNVLDTNAMREAGDRFSTENQSYLDACWLNIALRQNQTFNGLDLRFKKAGFLYTTVQQIQMIKESLQHKYALIDEGLIHKVTGGGLYKSNHPEEEEKELMAMLKVTPLPDAFIFLQANVEETTLRLSQRKRIINMHKSLSPDEIILITRKTQERMDIANKYLEEKGVPILYLDAQSSIENKKQKIQSFFQSLK